MFLHDIRCIFPSGISSRKSLAKFAFQEMLVSLCFCQRSQRVGAALESHSRSLESLSSKKGQVAAKCYFLSFTIPWKLEQSGTWILSILTLQLLQLPWNWALRRPEYLLQ